MPDPCNVLFLCTGNSARSIIAEALLNHLGGDRFRAYSAGSRPGGLVNPVVLEHLEANGVNADRASSKSWDVFAWPDAPRMDLVITVCDQAAGDECPFWPGAPARAHWSAPDPPSWVDDPVGARRVVGDVFLLMQRRIRSLVELPVESLDRQALQQRARAIAERT
jgi:protein-tyrosine-phosphatase